MRQCLLRGPICSHLFLRTSFTTMHHSLGSNCSWLSIQAHQHLFCARLDFSVDDPAGGKMLTVSEVGTRAD